jgi:hypothetical protein
MTKEEAVLYTERWALIERMRVNEVRQMSPAQKLKNLGMLFNFGQRLGWPEQESEPAWASWKTLKERSNV